MSKRRIALLVVLGVAVATMLALAINISAQAQDYGATAGGESGPTTSAGGGGVTTVVECPDPRGRGRVRCSAVTILPSTGFALALFSVAGAGALGTGLVLARKSRP